jgi:hypothetical protein
MMTAPMRMNTAGAIQCPYRRTTSMIVLCEPPRHPCGQEERGQHDDVDHGRAGEHTHRDHGRSRQPTHDRQAYGSPDA